MKTEKEVLRNRIQIGGLLIFCIFLLAVLVPNAAAVIVITPVNVTSTSIMWQWPAITVQNLSVDGVFILNFNPAATRFTLGNLKPGEPHTIDIITSTDYGSNTTYTAADTSVQQSSGIMSLVNTWWYLVLIMVLCVVGMIRRLGFFLLVASAVSIYALDIFITQNVDPSSTVLLQIPFIIYLGFFVIPIWLCFGVKGGVFK